MTKNIDSKIKSLQKQMRDEMVKQNNRSSVSRSYAYVDELNARIRELHNLKYKS